MKEELLLITAIGALSISAQSTWAEDIESRIEIPIHTTRVLNNVTGSYRLYDEANGGIIGNAGTAIIDQASFFKKNYLYDFAGGVLSNTGKATINDTSFLSNKAEQGGAIYNNSTLEGDSLTITNSVLTGNQAYDWSPNPQGGAIYNDRGKIKIINSTFTSNNALGTAVSSGGAIYNSGVLNAGKAAAILEISDSTFNKNKSSWGGAIENSGKLNLTKVNFTSNVAEYTDRNFGGCGGALYNYWDLTVNEGLWKENTAFDGGAIFNRDKATISSTFIGNQAYLGGAIFNEHLLTVDNSTFIQNQAIEDESESGLSDCEGGAIYNEGTLQVSHSVFTENDTDFTGGAIFNGKKAVITDTTFTDNEVASYGGAIYSQSTTNLSEDAITITRATFTGNKAMGNPGAPSLGGAVYNDKGKMTISQSTFEGNEARGSAASSGGAIAISSRIVSVEQQDPLAILEIFDSTFKNNISSWGGAVDNGGKMDMANVTFIENKAIFNPEHGGCGGAIVNGVSAAGPLTITNGTYLRNSATGNGGAINNRGTLNLQGTNFFEGNTSINGLNDIDNQGTINISGKIILDGGISGFHGSNNYGTVIFANNTKLTVKPGTTTISKNNVQNNGAILNFNVNNGFSGNYALITDFSTLDNEFTLAENNLYNIALTATKGTYAISKKSNAEVAQALGISADDAVTVTAITHGESPEVAFNQVASDISDLVQSNDPEDIRAGIAAINAWAPDAAPLVAQIQTATTYQVINAVDTRLHGGIPHNVPEASSGDAVKGTAIWIQGLADHARIGDMDAIPGFKTMTYGVAVASEKEANHFKIGAGFALGTTDVTAAAREVEVKHRTLLAYSEYKPTNWFINGILSFNSSDYKETKNVASNLVTAEYTLGTFGVQAMTGYSFQEATPEVGLRLVRINGDDYIDSAGQKIKLKKNHIVTGVFAFKMNKTYKGENNSSVTPKAKLALTFDFKQAENISEVTLPNDSSYQVKGKNLARFGMEIGAGLTAKINHHIALSLGYEGKFRTNYRDHSGLFDFNYQF